MQSLVDVSAARPSSTVVLAREAADAPEIFMVRRHIKLSFGAAYAFPGGVLDPADSAVHRYCASISAESANSTLGVRSLGLDYYSAAIRELFEETGVLLADVSQVDENLVSVRAGLNDASENWADFVVRNELQLDCGSLHYISHWVTPEQNHKRYSTRFFVAELPPGQVAVHCGGELTASRWATARDILEARRNHEVRLIYPTIKTLESVARHKTIAALLEWAKS